MLKENKVFGLDTVISLYGDSARIKRAESRIENYLAGSITWPMN